MGRARVSVLVSENAVRTGKFRLAQQMGLDPQDGFEPRHEFELSRAALGRSGTR